MREPLKVGERVGVKWADGPKPKEFATIRKANDDGTYNIETKTHLWTGIHRHALVRVVKKKRREWVVPVTDRGEVMTINGQTLFEKPLAYPDQRYITVREVKRES
jgi:hypothetical protein